MPDDWHWRDDAACKGEPVETFVYVSKPVDTQQNRKSVHRTSRALDFCSRCTVVDECLQDAVDTGDTWRNKIRGGIRWWTDEINDLPEPKHGRRNHSPTRGL